MIIVACISTCDGYKKVNKTHQVAISGATYNLSPAALATKNVRYNFILYVPVGVRFVRVMLGNKANWY